MCIIASILNEHVHTCFDVERQCAYLLQFWMTMCILASVLDEDVHHCIGFGCMCILASVE